MFGRQRKKITGTSPLPILLLNEFQTSFALRIEASLFFLPSKLFFISKFITTSFLKIER